MEKNEMKRAIRKIGLALNASHNTIATDDPAAEPVDDYSWRVDNSKEIELLAELETELFSSN